MSQRSGSFQKAINEVMHRDVKGLTANPTNIADPNTMVKADNFYISKDGTFNNRPGFGMVANFRYQGTIEETSPILAYTDFVSRDSDTTVLMIVKGQQLWKYDGNTQLVSRITNGTDYSYDIFNGVLNKKDAVQFGGNLIIVQGDGDESNPDRIYIMSGTTDSLDVTNDLSATTDFSSITSGYIDLPKADVYGNPVSVTSLMGRLYVITDKGYLRYSAISNPAVWEERVLMLGTVSGTASLDTILGTGTAFTQTMVTNTELAPGAGVRLYITDGTNSEYVTIESITDATNIILTSSLTYSYTDASYFIIGIDFQEPIAPNDGLKCRSIEKFGNLLAITRTYDDPDNSTSDMSYCRVSPVENSYIVQIEMKALGGSFDIHPYSMLEMQDNLIFVSSDGVYQIKGSDVFNDGRISPVWLSKNKLETEFKELSMVQKNNTRVTFLRNRHYRLMLVSVTYKGGSQNTLIYAGYQYAGSTGNTDNQEFTKLFVNTYIQNGVTSGDFRECLPFKDHLIMLTDRCIYKSFDPDILEFTDSTYTVLAPLASSTSTVYNCSSGAGIPIGTQQLTTDYDGATGIIAPVSRSLKTGNFDLNLLDKININRISILTAEAAPTSGVSTFQISLVINDQHKTINMDKMYDGSQTKPIRGGSIAYRGGSFIAQAGSGFSGNYSIIRPFRLLANCKYADTVAIEITDVLTGGSLSFSGWGIAYKKGKYVC